MVSGSRLLRWHRHRYFIEAENYKITVYLGEHKSDRQYVLWERARSEKGLIDWVNVLTGTVKELKIIAQARSDNANKKRKK